MIDYLIIEAALLIPIISFLSVYLYKKQKLNFLVSFYNFLVPYKNTDIETNIGLYNEVMNTKAKLSADNKNKELFMAWQEKARTKLIGLLNVSLTKKIPEYKVLEKKNIQQGLHRYLISYRSLDNVTMYAYLFKHNVNKPAIIIISGSESGIKFTAGIKNDYNNKNALFFAKKGFNVITAENRGDGFLGSTPWFRINANANSIGKSFQGVVLDDQMLALNILNSLETTDKKNIFAAGCSLGAEQCIYLAALDKRIKAIAAFGWLSDKTAFLTGHRSCWSVHNLYTFFDNSDIPALIAPRPALYGIGKKEDIKHIDSFTFERAKKTADITNKSYKLFGKKVDLVEHPGGHEFDNNLAYSFIEKRIGP